MARAKAKPSVKLPTIFDLPGKRIRTIKAAIVWLEGMTQAHDDRATKFAGRRDYGEAHHSASLAAAYEYAARVLRGEVD